MESRSLPVPDGLDGTRVDAALAKLMGFSRTFARRRRRRRRRAVGRRDARQVRPPPRRRLARCRVAAEGSTEDHSDRGARARHRVRRRRHRRGRQAHRRRGASVGRLGGSDGGRRSCRRGIPRRHEWRSRAPGSRASARCRHQRPDGRREIRTRLHGAEAGVQGSNGREDLSRRGARAPRPARRDDRRADRAPPEPLLEVRRRSRRQALGHTTTRRSRAFPGASLLEIHLETGRTHQIRVHMAAHRHPCVGDPLYGADPTMSARLGLTATVASCASAGVRAPGDGDWVQFESPYPEDFRHALDVLRGE